MHFMYLISVLTVMYLLYFNLYICTLWIFICAQFLWMICATGWKEKVLNEGGEWYIATMHCIQFMAQERLCFPLPATTLPQFWKISLSSFLRFHFSSFFFLLSLLIFHFYTFTFQLDYTATVLGNISFFLIPLSLSQFLLLLTFTFHFSLWLISQYLTGLHCHSFGKYLFLPLSLSFRSHRENPLSLSNMEWQIWRPYALDTIY